MRPGKGKRKGAKISIGLTTAGAVLSALYLLGMFLMQGSDYTYRMWVKSLGKTMILMVLPLLLLLDGWLILRRLEKRKKAVVNLLGGAAAFLYLLWCPFAILYVAFTVDTETRLVGDLLLVSRQNFLDAPTEYYGRQAYLFFRIPGELTDADREKYLEEKYGRDFEAVSAPGEDGGYGNPDARILFRDVEYPDVCVSVYREGRSLADDYVECMTVRYLEEGCRRLGIQREYEAESREGSFSRFYLLLEGREDVSACSGDVARLLQYVTGQTDLFRTYRGMLYLKCRTQDLEFVSRIPFGKTSIHDEVGKDYWRTPGLVETYVADRYESDLEQARKWKAYQDSQEAAGKELEEISGQGSEGVPQGRDEEKTGDGKDAAEIPEQEEPVIPDPLEEMARLVYEVLPEGEDYSFQVCYNAKGNFYIDLGSRPAGREEDAYAEGSYRFTLVYDRPSQNDRCELFVFYKEHYTPGEGSGDSVGTGYNDSTAILEFYAVDKETGSVTAAGKRAWGQVGCEAYREATGE